MILDYLEIPFWMLARWLIRRGYGANCKTRDIDDFKDAIPGYADNGVARCSSCRAKEVVSWIDSHIRLLKM